MPITKLLLAFVLFASQSFGAIGAVTQWEVRTAGADTNGGGYSTGGTDMSIFDNKNAAACTSCQSATVNISTTDGVAAGTATITSLTGNYSSALIGNVIYVSGGTGSITAGWYQVASVTNSTTIVVDRSTGLTAGTGVTINIGGALLTIPAAPEVAGNTVWVQAGTYSVSATITQANGSGGDYVTWAGYSSVRGDNGQATIAAGANSISPVVKVGVIGVVKNFIVDGTGRTGTRSVTTDAASVLENVEVKVFGELGVLMADTGSLINVWVHGGLSACTRGIQGSANSSILGVRSSANACEGIFLTTGVTCRSCISDGQTASANGYRIAGTAALIDSVAYNNAAAGVSIDSGVRPNIRNFIGVNNGTYAVTSATTYSAGSTDYNFYYGNSTASVSGWPLGTHDKCPSGCSAGTTTGVPFTNAGSADFSLNNTAAAGAMARNAGFPGVLLSGGTGYADMGALRHQDAGGSSTVQSCVIAQ